MNFNQVNLNFTSGLPLPRLIEDCGYFPSVQVLYAMVGEASPLQQSALKLEEDESIISICKVYCADKIPVVLVVDDIPLKYLGSDYAEEDLFELPIYLIQKCSGIYCVRDEVQISTADSGSILAYSNGKRILDCESALALNIVNYGEDNNPIFLSKEFFNTSYIKFHMVRSLDSYRE